MNTTATKDESCPATDHAYRILSDAVELQLQGFSQGEIAGALRRLAKDL